MLALSAGASGVCETPATDGQFPAVGSVHLNNRYHDPTLGAFTFNRPGLRVRSWPIRRGS